MWGRAIAGTRARGRDSEHLASETTGPEPTSGASVALSRCQHHLRGNVEMTAPAPSGFCEDQHSQCLKPRTLIKYFLSFVNGCPHSSISPGWRRDFSSAFGYFFQKEGFCLADCLHLSLRHLLIQGYKRHLYPRTGDSQIWTFSNH